MMFRDFGCAQTLDGRFVLGLRQSSAITKSEIPKYPDPTEMRDQFYRFYEGGHYFNYGASQANEIVAKGLAVFAVTRGDPKLAITTAVNFGRDTDCLAAVAGGLAGALAGIEAIPSEWTEQVNEATRQDPYTNNHRTIEETADGLLEAHMAYRTRLADYLTMMEECHDCHCK